MAAEDVRGADLRVDGVAKRYGAVVALGGVSLSVAAGEFLTILGPSGSGKTTLLKVVAGFEFPDAGRVAVGGADITDVSPAKRNIGMVFQNYALFPHMSVARNIAFPLLMRGVPKSEIERRVNRALELVELQSYGERRPSQLSGGQQQRVALARAIVFDPTLLLLDEPFGALDRKLRESMQLEVRRLQRRLGLTTVFITHDQEEALVLSDRIAVMDDGVIRQVGAPDEIYDRPADDFVAQFIGESNLLAGEIAALDRVVLDGGASVTVRGLGAGHGRVRLLVRPEKMAIDAATNRFTGTVVEAVYLGEAHKLRVKTAEGIELLVRGHRAVPAGASLTVGFAPEDAHVICGAG
ncbi:MAG: ABC transporter ATP-binding protein [Proteobacteria bacterium]|nr:ABC transporter ATP-binding protein [Pseudomonadota bacterium]